MNLKFKKLVALSMLITLGFAAMPVRADAPLILLFPINSTATFTNCGFPVVQHREGTVRYIVRFDGDDNPISVTAIENSIISFTNPLNGKSLSSQKAYTDREVFYSDGSSIFVTSGLVAHLVLPGLGLVAANVGHTRATFDAQGNVIDFQSAGMHDGPLRFLVCPYLE